MQESFCVSATYLGRVITWPLAAVTHFTADSKYVIAHHEDGRELLLNDSLVSLERQFTDQVVRVRRNYLVPRQRLTEVNPHKSLVMVEGAGYLPSSRRYLAALKKFKEAI